MAKLKVLSDAVLLPSLYSQVHGKAQIPAYPAPHAHPAKLQQIHNCSKTITKSRPNSQVPEPLTFQDVLHKREPHFLGVKNVKPENLLSTHEYNIWVKITWLLILSDELQLKPLCIYR